MADIVKHCARDADLVACETEETETESERAIGKVRRLMNILGLMC